MGQMSPASARALEGKAPIGEAHGRPPDLPNPQTPRSAVLEPESDDPKACVRTHQAQRSVVEVEEGAHVRPDPWSSLGVVTIDPAAYFGSASLLEGEQNLFLTSVG